MTSASVSSKLIAAVIDAGACPLEPTTVIDLTGGASPRSSAKVAGIWPAWACKTKPPTHGWTPGTPYTVDIANIAT
jgi:hypothetical protein